MKCVIWFNLIFLIFKASERGHHEVVSLLINNDKIDCINEKTENGYTALHFG